LKDDREDTAETIAKKMKKLTKGIANSGKVGSFSLGAFPNQQHFLQKIFVTCDAAFAPCCSSARDFGSYL